MTLKEAGKISLHPFNFPIADVSKAERLLKLAGYHNAARSCGEAIILSNQIRKEYRKKQKPSRNHLRTNSLL